MREFLEVLCEKSFYRHMRVNNKQRLAKERGIDMVSQPIVGGLRGRVGMIYMCSLRF